MDDDDDDDDDDVDNNVHDNNLETVLSSPKPDARRGGRRPSGWQAEHLNIQNSTSEHWQAEL